MEKSEEIAELVKALAKFHEEVEQPKKDANNPHFKSEYVTLDELIRVINKTSVKHGLIHTQEVVTQEGSAGVRTSIMHTSGQYITFDPVVLPSAKETPQQYGSSITYARRYALSAAFGLASEVDDDGNAGSNSKPQNKTQSNSQQRSQNKPTQSRKDMKKEQESGAPKATMQQKNQITKEVKELAGIRGTQPAMVFQHLKISDLEAITQDQAKEAISTLAKWFEQANNSKEKQEA